MISTKLKAS